MATGGVTDWPQERRPAPMGILETMTPASSVCGHQGSPPSASTVDSLSLPFVADGGSSGQACKLRELELVVAAKDSIIHDLGLQIEMVQQQRGASLEPCAIPTSGTGHVTARGRHNVPALCKRPLEAHVTSLREEYASLRIRLEAKRNSKRSTIAMLHGEVEDLAANAGALQTEHMELHSELDMARQATLQVPTHLSCETSMAALAHEELQGCLRREAELQNAVSKIHDAQGHQLCQRLFEEEHMLQECHKAQARLLSECSTLQSELVEKHHWRQEPSASQDTDWNVHGTSSLLAVESREGGDTKSIADPRNHLVHSELAEATKALSTLQHECAALRNALAADRLCTGHAVQDERAQAEQAALEKEHAHLIDEVQVASVDANVSPREAWCEHKVLQEEQREMQHALLQALRSKRALERRISRNHWEAERDIEEMERHRATEELLSSDLQQAAVVRHSIEESLAVAEQVLEERQQVAKRELHKVSEAEEVLSTAREELKIALDRHDELESDCKELALAEEATHQEAASETKAAQHRIAAGETASMEAMHARVCNELQECAIARAAASRECIHVRAELHDVVQNSEKTERHSIELVASLPTEQVVMEAVNGQCLVEELRNHEQVLAQARRECARVRTELLCATISHKELEGRCSGLLLTLEHVACSAREKRESSSQRQLDLHSAVEEAKHRLECSRLVCGAQREEHAYMHEALRRTSDDLFNLKHAAEQHVAGHAAQEAAHRELNAALAKRIQGEEENVQQEQMQLRWQKQEILASEEACHSLRLDVARAQSELDLQRSSLRGCTESVQPGLHILPVAPQPHSSGDFTADFDFHRAECTPRHRTARQHVAGNASEDANFKSRSEEALRSGAAAAPTASAAGAAVSAEEEDEKEEEKLVGASGSQQALPLLSAQSSLADMNDTYGHLGAIDVRDTSSHIGNGPWAHEGFALVTRDRPKSWSLHDPEAALIQSTSISTMPPTPSSARTATPQTTPRVVTALNAAPPSWQHPLAAKQGHASSYRRKTAKLQCAASPADRTSKTTLPASELDAQQALSATVSRPVLPKTRRVTAKAVHVPCTVAIKDGPVDAADDCFWTNVLSTSPLKPWEARMAGISSARVSQVAHAACTGVRTGPATAVPVPLLALPSSGSSIQPLQALGANTGAGCGQETMWASLATPPSSSRNISRWDRGFGLQGDGQGPMWASMATPPNSTRDHVAIEALVPRML